MNRDIVIRAHDSDLASRLTLYSGTAEYHEGLRLGHQMYRPGAFLPRGVPRMPSACEVDALTASAGGAGRHQLVGIVRLSAGLVAALRAAKVDEGRIPPEALNHYPYTELAAELLPSWVVRAPLMALGYADIPSGFLTVTFDGASSRFIGLHIDDLDALEIAHRESSTTRLCINLGEHSRYLVFLNVTTRTMVHMLAGGNDPAPFLGQRSTPLIHAFLRAFPDYPVVRLEIRPCEAYIAPTENMIHDGSTTGMGGRDQQVTLRGIMDPVF